MIKNQRLQGVFIGAIGMTVLLSSITVFAEPLYKQISVNMGGIKIFVDGKKIEPKDANGKVVEPLIYEGTTYLPVRAITNALTNGMKPIEWDEDTWSVYLGGKPISVITAIQDLKPISGSYDYSISKNGFEVRQQKYTPNNDFKNNPHSEYDGKFQSYTGVNQVVESPKYLLNGKYLKLTGNIVIDDKREYGNSNGYDDGYTVLKVYTSDAINGGYKLIYTSPQMKYLGNTMSIEVPMTAVDRMYFSLESSTSSFQHICHFYNIELTEAKD